MKHNNLYQNIIVNTQVVHELEKNKLDKDILCNANAVSMK